MAEKTPNCAFLIDVQIKASDRQLLAMTAVSVRRGKAPSTGPQYQLTFPAFPYDTLV
jgi:hypothetical protein